MKKSISVDAIVRGSLSDVWRYYTDPGHIVHWNFASSDWHCPEARNDLRTGGTYFARMEAKDGSGGFDFTAVYDEVEPLKKLAYTMPDGRSVITSFETVGDTVRIATVFDAEEENPVDMQKAGWQAILNQFRQYAERPAR